MPKRRLFFHHALPIFLEIHPGFLCQIGFVWRKNFSPSGKFPFFKQRLADPARFIAYGGTGRIRVYGIQDYDYADVTLDRQGGLRCSLVKVAPLEAGAAPNQQPLDPPGVV